MEHYPNFLPKKYLSRNHYGRTRHVEYAEYLHLRIDVILFLFVVRESLVVVVLDFLFRLLVYAGKGS